MRAFRRLGTTLEVWEAKHGAWEALEHVSSLHPIMPIGLALGQKMAGVIISWQLGRRSIRMRLLIGVRSVKDFFVSYRYGA